MYVFQDRTSLLIKENFSKENQALYFFVVLASVSLYCDVKGFFHCYFSFLLSEKNPSFDFVCFNLSQFDSVPRITRALVLD